LEQFDAKRLDSDFLNRLYLRGRVYSGKGEGAKFVSLPWARKQMEEKLGYPIFPGTLNIKLRRDSIAMRESLIDAEGIEILPTRGLCRGKLFKARLRGVECALIVPEVSGYSKDVIEIVAKANLREELGLFDGAFVEVEFTV
jgi:riboflavin kinase